MFFQKPYLATKCHSPFWNMPQLVVFNKTTAVSMCRTLLIDIVSLTAALSYPTTSSTEFSTTAPNEGSISSTSAEAGARAWMLSIVNELFPQSSGGHSSKRADKLPSQIPPCCPGPRQKPCHSLWFLGAAWSHRRSARPLLLLLLLPLEAPCAVVKVTPSGMYSESVRPYGTPCLALAPPCLLRNGRRQLARGNRSARVSHDWKGHRMPRLWVHHCDWLRV